jgi:peptidoglycan hydrolase CwlO-like protein
MSTTEEKLALLNNEKQLNIEAIDLLTRQINDLNQAIINTNSTIDQYNVQIETYNSDISQLTSDNIIIDEIIIIVGT